MAKRRNHNGAAENHSAAKSAAAYFLSLTLENVRCFSEKQTLDLSDGNGRPARWTVLLGNNGTGKTTLLQALAGFESVPAQEEEVTITGASGRSEATAPRAVLRFLSSALQRSPDQLASITAEIVAGDGFTNSLGHYERIIRNWQIKGNGSCFNFPVLKSLKCYAYGASRRLSLPTLSAKELDEATASLFSDDANLRNAEDWLLRLDYVAKASEQSSVREYQKRQRDLITALLIEVLPEVEEIRFDTGVGTHPSPKVEAKTPYGWVGFRQLGHGYRTLIAWMVDLVSRLVDGYPDDPNPLEAPAVVLVDEIDLHMHPIWQRKLMDELTKCFPNTQFIVTAHSPLIVQAAAEDANIALLHREGDHVVIDNDVGYIRGWSVDQLLTSDLFGLPSSRPPQFDAMFERRKTLLGKSKRTAKEEQELATLNKEVHQLPYGETADQAKMMSELSESLELLKQNQRKAQ